MEKDYINEVIVPSFEKVAALFQEEGIESLPSMGPYEDPGVLLIYPEENVIISCNQIDGGDPEMYRYTVFVYDGKVWSFPCFDLPENFEGIRLLPLLYHTIRNGNPEEREDDLPEMYIRTRMPYLKDALSKLGMPTVLEEGFDGLPYLLGEEAGQQIKFSYEAAFPEWQATILKVTAGKRTARIPEFGAPMKPDEYEKILSLAFEV